MAASRRLSGLRLPKPDFQHPKYLGSGSAKVTLKLGLLRFGARLCSTARPHGRNQTSAKPLPSPSGEGGSRPALSPAGASRVRGSLENLVKKTRFYGIAMQGSLFSSAACHLHEKAAALQGERCATTTSIRTLDMTVRVSHPGCTRHI